MSPTEKTADATAPSAAPTTKAAAVTPAGPSLSDRVRVLARREVDAGVIDVLLAIAAEVEKLSRSK